MICQEMVGSCSLKSENLVESDSRQPRPRHVRWPGEVCEPSDETSETAAHHRGAGLPQTIAG